MVVQILVVQLLVVQLLVVQILFVQILVVQILFVRAHLLPTKFYHCVGWDLIELETSGGFRVDGKARMHAARHAAEAYLMAASSPARAGIETSSTSAARERGDVCCDRITSYVIHIARSTDREVLYSTGNENRRHFYEVDFF